MCFLLLFLSALCGAALQSRGAVHLDSSGDQPPDWCSSVHTARPLPGDGRGALPRVRDGGCGADGHRHLHGGPGAPSQHQQVLDADATSTKARSDVNHRWIHSHINLSLAAQPSWVWYLPDDNFFNCVRWCGTKSSFASTMCSL